MRSSHAARVLEARQSPAQLVSFGLSPFARIWYIVDVVSAFGVDAVMRDVTPFLQRRLM